MKKYKSTCDRLRIVAEKSDFPNVKISSSSDAAKFIRDFYPGDIEVFESFFILLLNRAGNTIGYVKISQGGTAGTVVDPKIIAKYAVESLASGVILAHNHPSGSTTASEADIRITTKVKNGLLLLDIAVIDHVIITAEKHCSFADEGIL